MSSNPYLQDYIRHLKSPSSYDLTVSTIEAILPNLRNKYLRNPSIVDKVLAKEAHPLALAHHFNLGSAFWLFEYNHDILSDDAALILKVMVGILPIQTLGVIKINTDFRRSKFLRHCPTMQLRINKQ